MMQFEYFRPAEAVRPLIGSYYAITVPEALSDVMRAEIANAREGSPREKFVAVEHMIDVVSKD